MTEQTVPKHLRDAEDEARHSWARFFFKNRKRVPEGVFDGDTGKFKCSLRESRWRQDGRIIEFETSPRSLHTWSHIYHLCMKACEGADVPPDVEASFRTDYPTIHERVMLNAVNAHLKTQSDQHTKAQRQATKALALAESQTAVARLAERRAQLAGLELKLKKLQAKEKALLTRMKRVKRSIGALERSASK